MNPVYENPDWAAGFDVVVHDECSSDVKDSGSNRPHSRPHREGLPSVVLHCGMHCYRSQGYPKEVTPWFEFTGLPSTGHGPQLPIAVTLIDRDSPILHGSELDHGERRAVQQFHRQACLPTGAVLRVARSK